LRVFRLIVTGAIGVVLALSLVACGGSSREGVQSTDRVRGDLESIIEEDTLLDADPASTLNAIKLLGVDRVRVDIRWSTLAPAAEVRQRPAHFNAADPAAYPAAVWTLWDTIVRDAAARGVALDFSLVGPPPLWASGPGAPKRGGPFPQWRPSASDFGAFVHAFGERYSGHYVPSGASSPLPRVSFWSVWNEPNYGPNLAPQAIDHSTVEVSPALYRGLLDAAWAALKATGHGSDTILIGETAPRGVTTGDSPGNFSGMVPLRFIRALYCLDASLHPLHGNAATERGCPASSGGSGRAFAAAHPVLFQASGFADHPYPQGRLEPNVVIPGEPDYADLATIDNLERTLDRAAVAYGSKRSMPIYSTEFGYQTDPPEIGLPDPVTAARYLNWSEYISWRNPRIRSYDQYLLRDVQAASATGGFPTGLQFKTGAPKATYDAFRMPLFLPKTIASKNAQLEVWGSVRPAHYAQTQTGRVQRVQIQFAPGTSAPFATVKTVTLSDPHGYFDVEQGFGASGRVRLAWRYPAGPEIHSRTVAVTVR
jgi:hypothetical protein